MLFLRQICLSLLGLGLGFKKEDDNSMNTKGNYKMVIKFFGAPDCAKDEDIFLNDIILKWYNWDNDSYYNNKYTFTSGNDYTHAIFFNKIIPLKEVSDVLIKSLNSDISSNLKKLMFAIRYLFSSFKKLLKSL